MTQVKSMTLKAAAAGRVTAVFSTFGVIDHDGDVLERGAFTDGADVVISAYGHASHGGALPVGKGVIRTTSNEAILEGQFFMDTIAGRDTFEVVKELGPLGEWSYSLADVKAHRGELEGRPANFITSVRVKEVSPVLLGASLGTRTLAAKSLDELGMAFREDVKRIRLQYFARQIALQYPPDEGHTR